MMENTLSLIKTFPLQPTDDSAAEAPPSVGSASGAQNPNYLFLLNSMESGEISFFIYV